MFNMFCYSTLKGNTKCYPVSFRPNAASSSLYQSHISRRELCPKFQAVVKKICLRLNVFQL